MSTYLADSDFELLLIERTDGVAFVTVNAPPMNVMTPPLFRELAKFGAQAAEDDSVRVVVLRSDDPDFFIAHFDVSAILEFPVEGPAEKPEKLEGFLDKCGLDSEFHNMRTETYSKGMRQKVGIALALAKDTKVLLLDEPTSGLDPKASNEFGELLQQLKNKGSAVLMATHDLFRAKEVATHIGIMKHGQMRKELEADKITLVELESSYLDMMNHKEVLS